MKLPFDATNPGRLTHASEDVALLMEPVNEFVGHSVFATDPAGQYASMPHTLRIDVVGQKYPPGHGAGDDDRGGQNEPGPQTYCVVVVLQKKPAGQSESTVNPWGQYDPTVHGSWVDGLGQ
jgi:hypothetical protein